MREARAQAAGMDGTRAPMRRRSSWQACGIAAALAFLPVAALAARNPDPVVRLPLEAMGYQQLQTAGMLEGSALLTVHFVDESHLLVTFGVRRLMPRDREDPPEDVDHVIGAKLVEIPSGKVIASTDWRMHDQGQYLWALGHGRFLLRIRDHLSVIAPMQAAKPEDAFVEAPFLKMDRHIVAVVVSAEDDLLTLETVEKLGPGQAAVYTEPNPAPVQVNFYRLLSAPVGNTLQVAVAGVVRAKNAFVLPITSSGFLDVVAGGRDRWLFNFDTHSGKLSELGEFETTCFPHVTFVSQSEFVAFGCRGGADKQTISGFNLRGEQGWQQSFFDTQVYPTFSFAPGSGRFALGRSILAPNSSSDSIASASGITGQEVRVFQTYSGKLLFKIDLTPVERTGQNFALSADGMELAVIRETQVRHPSSKDDDAYTVRTAALEIYALPPLTEKDQAAVKEAQGMAPAAENATIRLSSRPADAASSAEVPAAVAALPPAPTPQDSAGSGGATLPEEAKPESAVSGDPEPTEPRKPPTLYEPGEGPAGGNKPK